MCVILVSGLVLAKPTRPMPKLASISGLYSDSDWYMVHQDGSEVTVVGERWTAMGVVRVDGSVVLHWHDFNGGVLSHGTGLYRLEGKDLVGRWGYSAYMNNDVLVDGSHGHTMKRIEPNKE
jgi:hypothetical protein